MVQSSPEDEAEVSVSLAREHPCSSGCLMWVSLPAALLAVLAPEGLGNHSPGLEESMSA